MHRYNRSAVSYDDHYSRAYDYPDPNGCADRDADCHAYSNSGPDCHAGAKHKDDAGPTAIVRADLYGDHDIYRPDSQQHEYRNNRNKRQLDEYE